MFSKVFSICSEFQIVINTIYAIKKKNALYIIIYIKDSYRVVTIYVIVMKNNVM